MELKVSIKYGSLELTSSGVVLVYGDKPTRFSLYDNDDVPFDIVMKFVNDRHKEADYTISIIDGENAIEITCINFNEPIGHRLNEPVRVGTAFNRELYMVFVIAGEKGHYNMKIVQYSFYLGKEVDEEGIVK